MHIRRTRLCWRAGRIARETTDAERDRIRQTVESYSSFRSSIPDNNGNSLTGLRLSGLEMQHVYQSKSSRFGEAGATIVTKLTVFRSLQVFFSASSKRY